MGDGGEPAAAAPGRRDSAASSKTMMTARVLLLDDTLVPFNIQMKSPGRVLLDMVCKHLSLVETDYFGLEYTDPHGVKFWLDLERPMGRQAGLTPHQPFLWLCVKFYTPDPAQLEDEFTRYLFALQIRRDLAQGHLQCNENTAALMAAYVVQAECGDYCAEEVADRRYASACRLVPAQDGDMERRVAESHRRLVGQTPAEADLSLLETARRCELYGVKMHPATDHEGVPLNLAVAHMGIVVFQNYYKINTFSWAKIRKLSFKRRRFLIKLHPEGHGYYKDTVEFFFENRDYCKNFWKKCVEHHGFFRCEEVRGRSRSKPRVIPRGSAFRFSGRTHKQMIDFVRENHVKRQGFTRSQSFRTSQSAPHATSLPSVGPSLSAHPLLPADLERLPVTRAERTSPEQEDTNSNAESEQEAEQEQEQERSAESDAGRPPVELPPMDLPPPPPPPPPPPAALPAAPPLVNGGSTAPDVRRKQRRIPADRAFFIAKEMLSTERTYRTDLRLLTVWFREAAEAQQCVEEDGVLATLFSRLEPICATHGQILRNLEHYLISWEENGPPSASGICDGMATAGLTAAYSPYVSGCVELLERIDTEYRSNDAFRQMYREFEMQQICYLPVAALVLKPLHRLVHLHTLLSGMMEQSGGPPSPPPAVSELAALAESARPQLSAADGLLKLMELQRDLVGCDALLSPADRHRRHFLREGCLQKLSKKGYQHRMFFLFSDVLVYTSRTTSPVPQFKAHGQLPLRDVTVEQTDSQLGIANCFTIFGGNRALVVAASSAEERDAWLTDLRSAIEQARTMKEPPIPAACILPASSWADELGAGDRQEEAGRQDRRPAANWRSNRTPHVCWHRGISVGRRHAAEAANAHLSGYLLRKFKNSDGWQKLWVVLTNFCLYFYKTFQDECPLTSLPLLGYLVSEPTPADNIHKDHVFKLQFKQHIYFFRAESRYTLERWLDVIGRTAACSPSV